MKKIESGIREDFDNIRHTSREKMLSVAGVSLVDTSKSRSFGVRKFAPVLVACLIFFMSGAMLATAITERPIKEGQLFFSDSTGNKSGWVSDYDDIAESIGQDFYYPTCGTEEPESFVSVMYSTKSVISATDPSSVEYYNAIQFNIFGTINYFWVDIHPTADPVYETTGIVYEKHGTVFHIREGYDYEIAKLGKYHVSGMIEGNWYTFYADSVEDAKAVIDGLKKTGS